MYSLLFGIILVLLVLGCDADYYYYSSGNNFRSGSFKSNCKITSHGIKTIDQLQKAINNAKDGAVILLDPIVYHGNIMINTKNKGYITLKGDSQCNNNTKMIGEITMRSSYWVMRDMVIENSPKAIDLENSDNIQLLNLVINSIEGNGIEGKDCDNILVDNLVMNDIGGDALSFSFGEKFSVNNMVVSDVKGIALSFDSCKNIEIKNTVARDIDREVIKISGDSGNGRIISSVINSNSPEGEGWMSISGDRYRIANTVATGGPRNGIVFYGCNYQFSKNIFTIDGNGYGVLMKNKNRNCAYDLGYTNMIMGGRKLFFRS